MKPTFEDTKRCTKCGEVKPRSEFVRRRTRGPNSVRPECAACGVKSAREWRYRNPAKVMLNAARRRAKDRGVVFALTEDDIEIPAVCPALGIPLDKTPQSKGPSDSSPSLDRIRPEEGYVPGNTIVLSQRANRAKNDLSLDELRRLVSFFEELTEG